jgi:Ran GTPase-activating protein (RanGAP) involved in mRNA processing and transport
MNNFSATVFSHVHSGKDVKQLGETLKQISTNRSSKAVEIQGETDRKESGVRLLDALVLNRMGNDDAKALAKALENNTRICYLGLYDHCIGDKGSTAIARALQRATQLVSLNLAENPLSSAAVRALLAPKTLRRLSLTRCTLIGEDIVAVAKVLEHDSNLQSIDLSTCGIDDAGVAALCASLAINSTLQCLSLNYNRFDAAGYVALAELMRSNTTIASLHVDQKKFQSESEDGLKALMDSLASRTNLIALDLSGKRM